MNFMIRSIYKDGNIGYKISKCNQANILKKNIYVLNECLLFYDLYEDDLIIFFVNTKMQFMTIENLFLLNCCLAMSYSGSEYAA